MTETFRFYKNDHNEWYVDLPSWTGDPAELEMVKGADTMLDTVSNQTRECFIAMSDQQFDDAEILILQFARPENLGGGGDYLLQSYQGNELNHEVWLCAVVQFVFKYLPSLIYFSKVERVG